MLSFLKSPFPQQRGWDSKNWSFYTFSIVAFILSPSLSIASEELKNMHRFSSTNHPTVQLDFLSSSPTHPSDILPLVENFNADSSKQNPIIYQDPRASQLQQPFLRQSNFPISPHQVRDPPRSDSSLPSISAQAHDKQSRTFSQLHNDERPQAGLVLRERQVNRLAKRQQADAASTPTQHFPQPFDTSLSTEFESDTCQPFMSKFLNNPSFQDCHPFSLLLTTSETFFRAYSVANSSSNGIRESSAMPVKQVLDAACKADVTKCAALFDQLATSINSSTIGCGKDLEKQNSLPLQALDGLRNYKLMREVGCLTTSESEATGPRVQNGTTSVHESANNSTLNSTQSSIMYCFEKAVSNIKPDDLYYYYLPLGTSLPSGTQSSCDQCTRSIMKLYSLDASNNSLALSKTYLSARTMTNSQCGPGFSPLPINVANRLASAGHRRFGKPSTAALKLATWTFIILNLFIS